MGLTEDQKSTYIETAKTLKGSDRRVFQARVVKSLGRGGQRLAEAELGWSRCTISKGTYGTFQIPVDSFQETSGGVYY